MESVFYFDQINNAGIFNIRIAAFALLHSSKCYPHIAPLSSVVQIVSPISQEFPRQPQNWSWVEIWLTELELELSFSKFKDVC